MFRGIGSWLSQYNEALAKRAQEDIRAAANYAAALKAQQDFHRPYLEASRKAREAYLRDNETP